MPAGWMLVRHTSGRPCYQHLATKVVVWSRPYAILEEEAHQAAQHEPPRLIRRVLKESVPVPAAKRQRLDDKLPAPAPTPVPEASAASAPAASLDLSRLASAGSRIFHKGCPLFDVDVEGKTPQMILNEFCPKVLRLFPEVVTVTVEDHVAPYVTTIICDGLVVAKGSFSSKKMSKQIAARRALQVLAPLLELPEAATQYDAHLGDAVGSAKRVTVAELEEKEVESLQLRLSDDRILENTVGKTPVMVLQEHCHKHVGELPVYTDCVEPGSSIAAPIYRVHVKTSGLVSPDTARTHEAVPA